MGDIVSDDHHHHAQERVLTRKTFNPCLEGNIAKGTTDQAFTTLISNFGLVGLVR